MKVNGRSARRGIPVYLTIIVCFLLISSSCTTSPPESPAAEPSPPPETPNPEVVSATDYLKSISDDLYEMYATFGLDEEIADYVLFVSSLPKDFGDYALQNKLCIQDRLLTDLEKQFLQEPDTYLQQMFDGYMTGIGTVDPGLADKLKLIPFLKEVEVKDVEALEDIASLAGRAEYRVTLEKIYGKGIERKMHPVALEKLVWDCYSDELDEPDLSIHTRLADFQAKYNTEMDEAEPVTGKKPQVLGINYLWEPLQWPINKSQGDIRFDYALMRWVLGANAVKIWGVPSTAAFDHVKLAHEEGLEVWLEYCPVYGLETTNPDISVADYCEQLAGFAKAAEEAQAEVLVVGHEVDVHLKRFDYRTGALRRAVDEMVKTARQNYSGLVTYCTWDGPWDVCNINWEPMDIIFPQIYKSDTTKELTDNEYLSIINKWKNKIPGKLMAISEFGSLTVSEGASIGGWNALLETKPYHYDPQAQADFVERQLKVLFKADVYGIFLHCWDEGNVSYLIGYNQSEVGYGIWDYKGNEPKPSFWVAYKYYRER
jgi:hypothetical protein